MGDDEMTRAIIGSAIAVHRAIGPGLLESVYAACLAEEFRAAGVRFASEVEVPLRYRGKHIEAGYRLDFLVEDEVVLELKAVEKLHPVHEAQLLTYLRLLNRRVGLMINFNVPVLREGIVRRVLG